MFDGEENIIQHDQGFRVSPFTWLANATPRAVSRTDAIKTAVGLDREKVPIVGEQKSRVGKIGLSDLHPATRVQIGSVKRAAFLDRIEVAIQNCQRNRVVPITGMGLGLKRRTSRQSQNEQERTQKGSFDSLVTRGWLDVSGDTCLGAPLELVAITAGIVIRKI